MTSQVGGLPLSSPHNAELRLRYLHWPSFVNREIRPREAGNTEYQLSRAWGVWIFILRQPSLAQTRDKTRIVSSQEWGSVLLELYQFDSCWSRNDPQTWQQFAWQLTSAYISPIQHLPPTLPSRVQQNRSDERLGDARCTQWPIPFPVMRPCQKRIQYFKCRHELQFTKLGSL